MVLVETNTPNGGMVFSAGSITYGASLLVDEVTSKLTANVLRHFLGRKLTLNTSRAEAQAKRSSG
jgi:hypothetical protein